LTLNRLGRFPLGNLLIMSRAAAFGDLGRASEWLGERLGTAGVVLPATSEPVSLVADAGGELIRGQSAFAAAHAEIHRLHFSPERPTVPGAVLEAIEHANLVLLAPGSLFTSVLAASALPDVARAQRVAPLPRPLRSERPGVHDPLLLRAALQKLFADLPERRTGGRVSGAQQLG
jgi:uncharacterized cofD-like protein